MVTPIEMPKLGNTVEECLIGRWRRQPGETVTAGEIIADIETDKATFELPSPVGGTVLAVFFGAGDLVPVYTNICVVGSPGEPVEAFGPKSAPAAPETTKAQPVVAAKRSPAGAPPVAPAPAPAAPVAVAVAPVSAPAVPASSPAMSPRARRFAEAHRFFPEGVVGSGPGGRILEEDLKRLYHESPRLSPLAARMQEEGWELRGEGSGAGGAVLSSDLTPPPAKVSKLRETIARRMRQSLASTAQYTLNTSAVATGLLSLRARIKAAGSAEDVSSININAMVMYCAIKALGAVPELNVEFVDGKLYQHAAVHIGFACDTPRGLLVPVVRDSERLTLRQLAGRIKALTAQAIDATIAPDDLTGGTFTVSNLGTYGIESFSPILNAPQVAILGVNTIALRPIRRNGVVEFIDHIGLSLTCDHQVIDGAPGARFLKTVTAQIENIESVVKLDGLEAM